MKQAKTLRASRPARASARPTTVEPTFWQRLAQFPERFRESRREARAKWDREAAERAAETREENLRRQLREIRAALRDAIQNPEPPSGRALDPSGWGNPRFMDWYYGARKHRDVVWPDHVVELTGVSEKDLLKVTKGAAFRHDYGRNRAVFLRIELEKWAKAQAGQAKAVAA